MNHENTLVFIAGVFSLMRAPIVLSSTNSLLMPGLMRPVKLL